MGRDAKLKFSILFNLSIKVIGNGISLALVPLLISILGFEKFGIWLTIYSFVGWFTILDLGLGNGLKLKLTEAFSKKRYHYAQNVISSAYVLIGFITIVLLFLFLASTLFVNWEILLGISPIPSIDASNAITVLMVSFIFILTFKLVSEIFTSLLQPFIDELVRLLSQLVFLVSLLLCLFFKITPSLTNIAIFISLPLIFIYFILSFYVFIIKAPSLRPSIKFYSKQVAKGILSPGVSFFFIQVSSIILYSSDNLIIVNLISPTAVTNYNISYKFFGLPFMIFALFISTHWVSFIDALSTADNLWIKRKLKLFNFLFLLLILVYVVFYFVYDLIVPKWIGISKIETDFFLNTSMIVYYLISAYATIYTYVVNASGKIALQKYLYLIIGIGNIPLSIIFVRYLHLGSSGVILASSICLLLLLIFMPIQSSKILSGQARGIWNR
jgi:O-antigen/teichoic acid export membrane protein